MTTKQKTTPPGWGEDDLSAFLEQVRQHQLATFHNKRTAYGLMKAVDACFMKVGTNMLNPKDALTPVFLYRAHSAFRAGCGTAMAGQSVETYVQLRACLECAAYGLFISKVEGMNQAWLNRNENPEAKKLVVREFQLKKIRPVIEACDKRLAEVFDYLYDLCIEQGGHPNQRAVMGSIKLEELADRKVFQQVYLHGDSVVLDVALKNVVETGICSLFLTQHNPTFTTRFQLLGVRDRLKQLQRETDKLVKKAA
jgi:hypothetical protein